MISSSVSREREIIGAENIAKCLGVSKRTVLRWWRAQKLPARQIGDRTSPLRMSRTEIETFKAARV